MATQRTTRKSAAYILAAFAVLAVLLGGVFGFSTQAFADTNSWADLSESAFDGSTKITFDGGMSAQNNTANAADEQRFAVRYADISGEGATVVLPAAGELPTPDRYKDQNGNPNVELKGWLVVPPVSAYENGDGTYHKLNPEDVKYYAPGSTVTITEDFVSAMGGVRFLADWGAISYNFGSDDPGILGGLRTDIADTDAIKTSVYDINGWIYNVLYARNASDGNWVDNHVGPVFIDTNQGTGEYGKTQTRPIDHSWTMETAPGYNAAVNEWNKGRIGDGREGASQGLWDNIDFTSIFDGSTPGITYVGSADKGTMFWKETDPQDRFNGYYVYNSKESAAVFNQADQRFYVYNQSQPINTRNGLAVLPLNKPQNEQYSYNDGAINYHFGLLTEIDFFLTNKVPTEVPAEGATKTNQIEVDGEMKDMEFFFSGDDDVFVFVDGKLALDIGGIHDAVEGSINFATGEVKTKRVNGFDNGTEEVINNSSIAGLAAGNHKLTIYYMERGASESNNMTTFLLTLTATIHVQKLETQTGEAVVYPGAEFYLQNVDGDYYSIRYDEGVNPDDPLAVPHVEYVADRSKATPLIADENGELTVRYLTDGKYTLTETKAPEYHEGLPGSFTFDIKDAKIVDNSLTFEADDASMSDKVVVNDDQVTLSVSNDRKVYPLNIAKAFEGTKSPAGVNFNIYELPTAPTKEENGKTVIDTAAIEQGKVPAEALLVYEGASNDKGQVTNYTWYPRGKEDTPADMVQSNVATADLKQGSVYYIVEDYADNAYYKFTTPIVVVVDEDGIQPVSDANDSAFQFEGANVFAWTAATESAPAQLDITNITINPEDPIKKVNGNAQLKDKLDEAGKPVYKTRVDADGNPVLDAEGNPMVLKDANGNPVTEKELDESQAVKLEERTSEFTYTISQVVPEGAKTISFEDELESVLKVSEGTESAKNPTVTVDGVDVAGAAINVEGQKVTATIEDASALEGKTVTLTIKASLRDNVTDAELIELYGDDCNIPNTAKVSINDKPNTTNTVVVTPPPTPAEEPEKWLDGKKIPLLLTNRDQEFTYTVTQKMPERATAATFTDTLEDVLEVIGEPTIDGKATYTVTFDQETNTVKATTEDASADRGSVVTLTIKARIKDGVTDEYLATTYGKTKLVPNQAEVSIDNNSQTTNIVEVTPPADEPEKFVEDSKELLPLGTRDQVFKYTVVETIPAGVAKAVFADTLVDVLEVKSASFTIDGEAYAAAEVVIDGNTVTATINNATQLGGKVGVLTINAAIKADVTDAQLIKLYGEDRVIPNQATVSFNDKPLTTNEVVVKPPKEDGEDPIKMINGDTKPVTLSTRPEFFEYSISQKIPSAAEEVIFEDTLEDVLEFTGTEQEIDASINANGAEITVEGQTIKAVLKGDAARAARDQIITLTFKAKIKDGVTDEDLIAKYGTEEDPYNRWIPNQATVTIDNKPKVTEKVFVTPPAEPGDKPVKLINGQSELVKLDNRYAPFVYTVAQKIPVGATSVVFTDVLESVLEVVAEDNEIGYAISIDGKATYALAYNTETNTVTASSDDVTADRGQVVTLTIRAKIKDNVSDLDLVNKYGLAKKVPNVAEVTIDDNPQFTDEVLVTPPNDPTPDPEKEVNGKKGVIDLTNRNEVFTYTVSQVVPATATKIGFEDVLEPVLQIVGKPTIDMAGAEIIVDGNKVVATASGKAVEAVRGQKVTLTINAKIADDVSELLLVQKYGDKQVVPNKATVTIDNSPKPTNEVGVTPPPGEGEEPVKKINGNFERVELTNRNDVFTYTVSQVVPATAKTVTFEDTLESALSVVSAELNVDPAFAEQYVTNESAGNTVKITITDAAAVRGQNVELTIKAKFREGISDAELIATYGEEMVVPNKATVSIDGTPKVTNTVEVTPPPENTDDPVKTVGYTPETQSTDTLELVNRNDEYIYTVTQVIPANATTVSFEDTLERVLEVVPEKTTITGAAEYVIQTDGNKVVAVTSDATADRGRTVTLTIVAKIRSIFSDVDLIKMYGDAMLIPNQAKVTIDNNPKFTNTVMVTPPNEPTEDPVKKVNGVDKVELADRNEIFEYTITQKIPANATTVTFEDVLEDVLEVTDARIYSRAKYDIAADGNKIIATTSDATNDRGLTVTLNIKAKIRSTVSDEMLIAKFGKTTVPNKAQVTINDTPLFTNEVEVTPPPTHDEQPYKTVNGRDHVDLSSQAEVFTYAVTVTVPSDATKFVIADTLEPVLEFAGGTAKLNYGGGNIAIEGQTITATYDGEAAIALRGKSVTLSFNAKIRDDADLSAYTNNTVPNQATFTINDDPGRAYDTNPVTVTPPEPPTDKSIIKAVNGVGHANLGAADEVFNYTLTLAVPADATKLVITDKLVPELEFATAAQDVQVSVGGSGVTKAIDGQTLTVTIDGITEETGLRGGTVVVGFSAKIKAGADLSKYGNKVPNAGSYTINDDPNRTYESNIVTVTPPEPTGSVDVVYVTTDGQILKPTAVVVQDGRIGSNYTTNQLDFAGYKFVQMGEGSDDANGTVEEGWKHVIYVYEPIVPEEPPVYGNVDVVYVTTDGRILKHVEVIADNEPVGTEYTTSQLDFPGYTFVALSDQSSDPSGVVEEGWKHVIYVYEPNPAPVGSVDVTYVTTDGKVLKDVELVVENGEVGSPYTTSLLNFDGYTFVKMDDASAAPAGLVEEGIKHVVYVYEPNPDPVGSVDVKYVTTDGTVLKDVAWVVENGKINTPYETSKLEFEGYTFVKMDDTSSPASGLVKEGTQHVIYVYEPIPVEEPTGNVDVIYVTEDGTVLKETTKVVENGKVGTPYSTDQLEFEGYEFKEMDPTSDPVAGLVKEGDQHVIYVYKPAEPPVEPVGSVDVKYVSTDGTVLRDVTWVVENGKVGTPYTTEELQFEGYKFVAMDPASAAAAGLVEEGEKHVIYVYEPLPEEEIVVTPNNPVNKPNEDDGEEKVTPKPPVNTPNEDTPKEETPVTPKTVTAVPSTVTPTPSASTPVSSPSPVASLATKTFDEFGPLVVALGALAVVAFAAIILAVRRRNN